MTNVSSLRSVASIITARDAAHALELANDSEFGLASTIYTSNVELAQKLAGELKTGGVFINGYCATDPRVTFGGVKKSGFGRELSHSVCANSVMHRPSGWTVTNNKRVAKPRETSRFTLMRSF